MADSGTVVKDMAAAVFAGRDSDLPRLLREAAAWIDDHPTVSVWHVAGEVREDSAKGFESALHVVYSD